MSRYLSESFRNLFRGAYGVNILTPRWLSGVRYEFWGVHLYLEYGASERNMFLNNMFYIPNRFRTMPSKKVDIYENSYLCN